MRFPWPQSDYVVTRADLNLVEHLSIDICIASWLIFAGNFDDCTWVDDAANYDLEHLGVVILECMKGAPNADLRDVADIRLKRQSNKLFGIDHGEKWSGCKLLIDFLDQLFNEDVSTRAKLNKQVGGTVRLLFGAC